MKFLSLDLSTLLLLFYLMMLVIIVPFFIGIPWLAILSLPIFFSALMGVKFSRKAMGARKAPVKTARPDRSAGTQTQTSF